ncbi:MAG: hypothetical protein LBS54_04860 [Dysgonamonadaceae bacterium]|jgi:signal transduction histidine kinase|nr:hypothetical protein [Dysgonamonadaceae bacterium]
MTFRQKIFLAFFLIFTLFTTGVVLIEQQREKKHKTEALQQRLDATIETVNHAILIETPIDTILNYLPNNIRITVINLSGDVIYDNQIPAVTTMENHTERPEIIAAANTETGTDIRTSTTTNQPYIYYARKYDKYYIRAAVPYDIHVKANLQPDNIFLYYIIALFVVTLILTLYASGQFEKTTKKDTRHLKHELTGNITHELRTPVTGIRGCLETVLENPLDDKTKNHFIQAAYNRTLALSELIHDMSLLTKIDDAPNSFTLEHVNIANIIVELKKENQAAMNVKNIKLNWQVPQNITVWGNRNLLTAIFRNLFDNAIRYAGNNITIHIIRHAESINYHHFTFSDTGIGIPGHRHLSRIFERFYRVNEGRTRDTGGSGLGLSIVKNAVHFHHGEISVKNRTGGGLEFTFRLPKN